MKKAFEISDFSGNIVELDKELLNFFKKLLEAFSKLQSKV